jgi:hypothetical protein
MSKLLKVGLDTLGQIDLGKISATLEVHLKRAVSDCVDRPGEMKPRSVIMQFDLLPIESDTATCDEVGLQISCTSKIPVHRTRVYSTGIRQTREGPMLVVNPDSPGNINQSTFLSDEEDGE